MVVQTLRSAPDKNAHVWVPLCNMEVLSSAQASMTFTAKKHEQNTE